MLGDLGLLLGTVGLGIVLLRNVIERHGELATIPTLAAGLAVGMAARLAAVLGALRVPLLPALKADR